MTRLAGHGLGLWTFMLLIMLLEGGASTRSAFKAAVNLALVVMVYGGIVTSGVG